MSNARSPISNDVHASRPTPRCLRITSRKTAAILAYAHTVPVGAGGADFAGRGVAVGDAGDVLAGKDVAAHCVNLMVVFFVVGVELVNFVCFE